MSDMSIRSHWVQIHEMEYTGPRQGEGEVQHLFAAVACSKHCAVAVLTAELPAEQDERERRQKIFGDGHGK
jgi:hypothetical protein